MQFVPTLLEVTIVIAQTDSPVMALVMGPGVNLLGNVTLYYLQVLHNATCYLNNFIISNVNALQGFQHLLSFDD
jgi:hypothetical protein